MEERKEVKDVERKIDAIEEIKNELLNSIDVMLEILKKREERRCQ